MTGMRIFSISDYKMVYASQQKGLACFSSSSQSTTPHVK